MPLKVHFLQAPTPRLLAEMKSQLQPEVQLTTGPELPALADFEILVATRITRQHLEASPNLRAFINPYTGIEVLLIALPLTPETCGLIGAAELALLPRGAVLVNVGRGPVVDEQALYTALRDGALGAAGLDVWLTVHSEKQGMAQLAAMLNAAARGEPMPNRVDVAAGY